MTCSNDKTKNPIPKIIPKLPKISFFPLLQYERLIQIQVELKYKLLDDQKNQNKR